MTTTWADKLINDSTLKQVEGKLKTDNGYCCMGVLCELANLPEKYFGFDGVYAFGEHEETAVPPYEFRKSTKLDHRISELERYAILGFMTSGGCSPTIVSLMDSYLRDRCLERSNILAKFNDNVEGADFPFIGRLIRMLGWDVTL